MYILDANEVEEKNKALNWLERRIASTDFCDIEYYTDILEDDVTHERQPFYLNVFVCICLISRKKPTYHWVTGVDIYITVLLWFGIYLLSHFFYIFFFILQIYISNEILCFLIPLNVHLTYSCLDTEKNIIWNVYTFIITAYFVTI